MKYSLYEESRTVTRILFRALMGFVAGSLIYFVVLAVWWLAYPYQTATIQEPMKVLNANKVVLKSEQIRLSISIDKKTDITPIVTRNIICGTTTYFVVNSIDSGGARPRGMFTATVKYDLPEEIPDGEVCYFQFTNSYRVNPLKVIDKVWKSEVFQVIESE